MICIYCAGELGMNQQYYHKCRAMERAGADNPLAIKRSLTMSSRVSKEMAEVIVSEKLGTSVEVLAVNQFYTSDLLYQVKYKVMGEDKVQETSINEAEILNLKRC